MSKSNLPSPMWDDEEETTPDSYLNKEQTDTFVTFNLDGCTQIQTGDKESREKLQTVSPNATTLHIQGLTKVNLETPAPRDQMKKQVKDAFRDTISCYLTSDWPKGENLSPNEVAQAFRDALTEEAQWYQKQAQRCEEFRRSVEGITFGNITYVPEEEEGAA